MNKRIDISLEKENIVSKNIYESFNCRFMGKVNTFEYNVNGEIGKKSIVNRGIGGSVVLPIFSDNNIILETQYRFPIRKTILEIPAGRIDEGESFYECAKRELREETGCVSDDIESQLIIYADPNFTDETIAFFIAKDAKCTDKQKLDADESVNIQKVSLELARKLINTNVICDERAIISIGYTILINKIRSEEDKQEINEIIDIIEKDEENLKEIETGILYSYDCEFGNIKDYSVITSNKQEAKRECMSLEPINLLIPISQSGKIGIKVKYMLAMEENSIELEQIKNVSKFKELGSFYTSVGYANSMCSIFISQDEKETEEYIWLTEEEIIQLIEEGKIKNGVVLAGLLKYLLI